MEAAKLERSAGSPVAAGPVAEASFGPTFAEEAAASIAEEFEIALGAYHR